MELLLLLSRSVLKNCGWPRISASVTIGIEKDAGELEKSSRVLVSDGSKGKSKSEKRVDDGADVVGVKEGWTTPVEDTASVVDVAELGENQLLSGGRAWFVGSVEMVSECDLMLLLALDLLSCFRPPRLVATYSHARPRFAHREHVGFSFPHFNLEDAQAWQLSRSLGVTGAVELRLDEAAGVGSP